MSGPSTKIIGERAGELRTYSLTTTAELRDHRPPDKQITVAEEGTHPRIRTGDASFDALYALAISEAKANSVNQISDEAYGNGTALDLEAYQTGERWNYVWTRDLSYSLHLALANFDPARASSSLFFKASELKQTVKGKRSHQIVQDTGSGGSYPISTDRVIWALGAHETLKNLAPSERLNFLNQVYPILCQTAEQDRRLIYDPDDGLYRGEQSFLDWREQTYPPWTADNVLAIGMSKALSTNAAHYFLLQTLAQYSAWRKMPNEEKRYLRYARELKEAINVHFYDDGAGLFSSYLLSDGAGQAARVARYDLLGQALTILFGIADESRAAKIITNYPVGPFGPPVVWPQESVVPIYHNQAIWPFVTAYWLKAAKIVQHAAAIDCGVASLQQLAAANLSNMENFDVMTGRAEVNYGERTGPVVNSRRQLWSVAGYLSMVQDIVFGFDCSPEGICFRPCVTTKLRNTTFGLTDTLELRDFCYGGTRHLVRLKLPEKSSSVGSIYKVVRRELNGQRETDNYIEAGRLRPFNQWDLHLAPATEEKVTATSIRRVDLADARSVFAPSPPTWHVSEAISAGDNYLTLHYVHEEPQDVSFRIYRDGFLYAENVREVTWTDTESGHFRDIVRTYAVEAVDLSSGNVSHRTDGRCYRSSHQQYVIPASDLQTAGGNREVNRYLEHWGRMEDEITSKEFTVSRSGSYLVRVKFSNGAGPVSTGIACAVKKLAIAETLSEATITSSYIIMPQSGDWERYELSSPVRAELAAGANYCIRIYEDDYCRNMTYLRQNERYTAAHGGGPDSYNYVNLAAVHIDLVAAH